MPRWKANLIAAAMIIGTLCLIFLAGYILVNFGLWVLGAIGVAFIVYMAYELVTGIYEIFKSIRNTLEKEL